MNKVEIIDRELVYATGHDLKTNIRMVAKMFKKHHHHVIRDIRRIISQVPENFSQTIFGLAEYIDEQGHSRTMYEMTKDGFILLVMGYNTKEAMAIKVAYIAAFNQMQHQIDNFNTDLMQKLLVALEAEKQSFAITSIAARIMRKRRDDKPVLQSEIQVLQNQLQPLLTNLDLEAA